MSIGWRNPQEDGYDITSFTFIYDTDNTKITCEAIDGYAFGTIESLYYNYLWEGSNGEVNAGDG
jgi:hypothetical protein